MIFEDRNVKSFIKRLFDNGGLAIVIAILVYLGVRENCTFLEAFGLSMTILIFFTIKSIIRCKWYIEKLTVEEDKIVINYLCFYKSDSLIIRKDQLKVELKGGVVKGKMLKIQFYKDGELKLVQYQSHYWTNERIEELYTVLSPKPNWIKIN